MQTPAPKPAPVYFDAVMVALRNGKMAKRPTWKTPMRITQTTDGSGRQDLSQEDILDPNGFARIGLHNQDLLADDWIII